ncbi:glycosyltransferase family 39 protein [Candidatus Microgenomates bacterium]|nr:glycosyltransferase family 39 protein [Candidatus Microgenomates bacterium]
MPSLFLLIAFHLFSNTLWINLNNIPPTWDAALHTTISLRFLEYTQNHLTTFNLVDFLKITDYYPPFVHWVGAILAMIGQGDWKTIEFSGTIFFIGAIIFLYFYTHELFKNHQIALYSSVFFSFFITVYQQSRDHMLDVPLTALFLAGLYFLAKSDHFHKITPTLTFFAVFALAFLTKWYAVVYFSVPLLFVFVPIFREIKSRPHPLKNLILGSLLFLIITAPWYLVNLPQIIATTQITSQPELADPQNLFSLNNLFFNLKLIIMFQLSFVGFLLLFPGIFFLVKSKDQSKNALLIISVLVFNYLFFTFIPNKNIRYLLPLMPFFAITMAFGLTKLPKLARWAIVAYFVGTYLILSFGFPFLPKYKYTVDLPLLGPTDILYLHTYPVRVLYQNTSFSYDQIVADIAAVKMGQIKILLLKDTPNLNNGLLDPRFYQNVKTRQDDFYYLGYDLTLGKDTNPQIADFLAKNVDVAVVSTNYLGLREAIREFDTVEKYRQFFLTGQATNFVLIKTYSLPADDFSPADTLLLYKK